MIFADLSTALKWQTAPDWWLVCGALLASGGVLYWLYARMLKLYPRKQALTLLALKFASVALIIFGFLRPALVREERDLSEARVILLVDDSGSMQTRDGSLNGTRLEDAKQLAFEKIEPALRAKLMVTPVAFSSKTKKIEGASELTGLGTSTDIPGAILESARTYSDSGKVGAYIVVTDGGDAPALPPGFSPGAPVFAVTVGSDLTKADDLRLENVDAPKQVDAKTEFEVKVDVVASGQADFFEKLRNTTLVLTENGKPVTQQPVKLGTDAPKVPITLRVKAGDPGIRRFKLSLPVLPTEAAKLNNERTITVEVRNPGLRLLCYAAELSQEYKPLRNALNSDPGIQFSGLIRVGGDRFLLQGKRDDIPITDSFPTQLDILKKFQCIVLTGSEARDIPPDAWKALEQYVSEGGSLILTGGPKAFGLGGWAATPLANVFPWPLASSEPPFKTEAVQVDLTPSGQAHPVFKGITQLIGANGPLARIEGINQPGPLRPNAQALLEAALPNGQRPAIVAFCHYGKGKVLGIATNTIWKWSLSGEAGNQAYVTFWRQSVRFLTASESEGNLLKLSADRDGTYPPGSQATVTARVFDRQMKPLEGASISATLFRIDESAVGPVTFKGDASAGTYTASVPLESAGAYRLQVSASDAKGVLETRELLLEAGAGQDEGAHLALNKPYLDELASRSGGLVKDGEHVSELTEAVLGSIKPKIRVKETSLLWDSPLFYLLFVGLMTAEWIVRRRMNLV